MGPFRGGKPKTSDGKTSKHHLVRAPLQLKSRRRTAEHGGNRRHALTFALALQSGEPGQNLRFKPILNQERLIIVYPECRAPSPSAPQPC